MTCHLLEFFYIENQHTWYDAQSYCKKNYSDLLTVYDMEHLEMFQELKIQKSDAWIGLQSVSVVGDWQWSQPGVDMASANWALGEPNNIHQIENCAFIKHGVLHDMDCSRDMSFLCYNGEDILLLFYENFLFNVHYLYMQ